ncbi:hypothetical protein ABL78_4590 [Leptomonas seymouri]|uniref:Uncharacterized protein n=1 Tax=Leptomonas seymouri TaxID=5684 RepID=A0A0N1PD33_LEPSE|nr:hypothetical protein ABL78_4590 [Leptomonas seymouri]|eukprot:KPI86364.1 hypothetical protein ABL78_4590 [Leptomonas seymouri]
MENGFSSLLSAHGSASAPTDSSGASPSPELHAAARTIQVWYRGRRACHTANLLLMWLHLLQLKQAMDNVKASGRLQQKPAPVANEPSSTTASADGLGRPAPASDAAVVARLLDAMYAYEAAKAEENLTRVLLMHELLSTSATVRSASSGTRRRLQQQHTALRRLSISETLAKAAIERHVRSNLKGQSGSTRTASQHSRSANAVDVLRELERVLTPPHFLWWRSTIEASSPPPPPASCEVCPGSVTKHVDAAVTSTGGPATSPLPPVPLQSQAAEFMKDWSDDDSVETLDALTDLDEAAVHEGVTTTAYEERCRAAYAAAKKATLAGCPLPEARVPSSSVAHLTPGLAACSAAASGATAVGAASAEPLCIDEELNDVHMVMQPVLGGVGVRTPWLHANTVGAGNGSCQLTCVVCELEGDMPTANGRDEDVCDGLVACATCGALVHACCACTGEVGGKQGYFCCSHCGTA